MTIPLRILVVEDSADDAEVSMLALSRGTDAPDWRRVESADEMRAALAEGPWDVVLADFSLPGFGAAEALTLCRQADPDLPFVVVSGTIGEQRAVDMMRAGAGDYLLKGNLSRLSAAVEREVREAEGRRARKRAEVAMRASETRYRRLFEAAQDGILIVDAVSRQILDANPFLTELLGYRREELVGNELWEIGLFRDIEANQAAFRTLQEQGYIRYEDLPLTTKDGRHIQVEFVSNTYDAGDARVIQCNIRDITERNKAEDAVRQSHKRLRDLIDGLGPAMFVGLLTPDGMLIDVNQPPLAEAGLKAEDVLGKPFEETHWWAHSPDIQRQLREAIVRCARGEASRYDVRTQGVDGQFIDIDFSLQPLRDEAGSVAFLIPSAVVITDRKRADEALRKSEEKFRTLAEAIPQIVWMTRPDGWNTYFNRRWMEYTGLTLAESVGDRWTTPFHPDDKQRAGDAWRHATATTSQYEVECRLRRADGVYRWWLIRGAPLRDPEGGILKWFGTCTDIDDLKRSEAERAELLARLNLQIERLPMAYLLSGPDMRYTRWNPAAERIFGFTQAEVLGKHPFEVIVPPEAQPQVANVFARLAAGDMDAHGSSENITRDGRHITCEWYNTPLFGPEGIFQGILSLAQDITARKLLEEQFRQAQKMEAFGQLAGGVAHDFNNLLTIINGYSDLLLESLPESDPSRQMIAEIHEAGERSAGLTRQLLAFSRRQVLTTQILNLNEVVADTDKMLRRLIGEDIRLTTTLEAHPWAVRADPGQVEQVLLNLAVNARAAMPKGGRLTIETKNVELDESYVRTHMYARAGPYVLLSVTDTGSGMPPEVLAKIFEPFFTTKETGKGTGLGLATVYGIVKQSGGHVAVYSEVGLGTSFKVYLPQTEEPSQRSPAPSRMLAPPRGTETILLAEDAAAVRALTRTILTGCGYRVLEAADGEEAVQVAAGHDGPIHLLITDVVMPGAGGRAVAERLTEQYPRMRVIYVSGYTDDAVIRHGVLREGVHFIQKPFTPAGLARKIRAVLDDTEL